MKIFVEKACLFKAYKPLSLKSYAKESSLYGAISRVLHFTQVPRAVFTFYTTFCDFKMSIKQNCLYENASYSFHCFY